MRKLVMLSSLVLGILLVGCGPCGKQPAGSGTGAVSPTPTPSPSESPVASPEPSPSESPLPDPADPVVCSSNADCGAGEVCGAFEGCGPAARRCTPDRACTKDLVEYCGCDGKTIQGSGSCPPAPFTHRGPCE